MELYSNCGPFSFLNCAFFASKIRKLFQKFFLVAIRHSNFGTFIFAQVEHIFAHQFPKVPLCERVFHSVPQMPGLFRRRLSAILDFERRAAFLFPVIDQHVKFSAGGLELANLYRPPKALEVSSRTMSSSIFSRTSSRIRLVIVSRSFSLKLRNSLSFIRAWTSA